MKVKLSLPESVRLTFQVGLFVFFVVLSFIYLFLFGFRCGFFLVFFLFLFYIFRWVLKVIINMHWIMQCSYTESGSWKSDKAMPILFFRVGT